LSINRELVHFIFIQKKKKKNKFFTILIYYYLSISKLSEVLILFLVKWIPIITISTPKIIPITHFELKSRFWAIWGKWI